MSPILNAGQPLSEGLMALLYAAWSNNCGHFIIGGYRRGARPSYPLNPPFFTFVLPIQAHSTHWQKSLAIGDRADAMNTCLDVTTLGPIYTKRIRVNAATTLR